MDEHGIGLVIRTEDQVLADVSDEWCVLGLFHKLNDLLLGLRIINNLANKILYVCSSIWFLLLGLKVFIKTVLHLFKLISLHHGLEE